MTDPGAEAPMRSTEALLAAAISETPLTKMPDYWAKAILATPSGQRLLAPTERERALEAALRELTSGMVHGEDCDAGWDDNGSMLDDPDDSRCDCGLSAALAALAQPSITSMASSPACVGYSRTPDAALAAQPDAPEAAS